MTWPHLATNKAKKIVLLIQGGHMCPVENQGFTKEGENPGTKIEVEAIIIIIAWVLNERTMDNAMQSRVFSCGFPLALHI